MNFRECIRSSIKPNRISLRSDLLYWNWDEGHCTIRAGYGPENITRLRRFATGLINSKSRDSVAATIAKLARNVRGVFDYLRMTGNSVLPSCTTTAKAGWHGFALPK